MAAKVLAPGASKLWTVPAGSDFLGDLARTLAEETQLRERPDALADALIYVPNRRSARALALALYKAGGERPFLPPDIRALGDLENDEPPTGTEEAIAGLGPPLSTGVRLGALAQLVAKFYDAQGLSLPATSALAAAGELGRLLDQAALSGAPDWHRLPDLVHEVDLAHHWERSVQFLKIVTEEWPNWLAAQHASDPFVRRRAVAEAIANHWKSTPPEGLVIIAGSTGATPASRTLMQSVQSLTNGRIIFPGLNQDADEGLWQVLEQTPDHPQHALAGALASLGKTPADVALWPTGDLQPNRVARRKLIQESLAPARATANWLGRLDELAKGQPAALFTQQALDGLSILTAKDESEEAFLAALLLRETLEHQGQTAALITPDAGLARRTASELKRWQIDLAPSAGTPLLRTPAGSYLALVFAWTLDPGDPVALCSLLKHPLCHAAPETVERLEVAALRGPRCWADLAGLIDHLSKRRDSVDTTAEHALLEDLQTALQNTCKTGADHAQITGTKIAGTKIAGEIAALASALAHDDATPWRGEDGAMAAKWLEMMGEVTHGLAALTPRSAFDVFTTLGTDMTVAPGESDARLAIWGPLEARLQSADRIILAGLNEGVWPAQPAPDGFLPRRFRADLGLEAPEARLGLAAHDFAQLACAPNVTILLSERREDAPAVASRWIWRLRTLAEGALGKTQAQKALEPRPDQDPRPWARVLEIHPPKAPDPHLIPRPTPPVEARPRKLSVTRITTLQRDPYAIYAERILSLRPLDPLNADLDTRRRGTAIHAALEALETEAPATVEVLLAGLEDALRASGEPEEVLSSVRASRRATAAQYMAWRDSRIDKLTHPPLLEVSGEIAIDIAGETFALSAKADRIEILPDGTRAIIDFKTGNPPSSSQILSGLEQQMPLQALIAEQGGFAGLPVGPVSELIYVAFKTDWKITPIVGVRSGDGPQTPSEFAHAAKAGLVRLIGDYQRPDTPYRSAPRVQFKSTYQGDYDRLARRAEWAGDADDD